MKQDAPNLDALNQDALKPDALDAILQSEETLVPASGFLAGVMERVQEEAARAAVDSLSVEARRAERCPCGGSLYMGFRPVAAPDTADFGQHFRAGGSVPPDVFRPAHAAHAGRGLGSAGAGNLAGLMVAFAPHYGAVRGCCNAAAIPHPQSVLLAPAALLTRGICNSLNIFQK